MPRILKLALIGTAAGAFSGLFGVGGGLVMVPLLILWLAAPERTLEVLFAMLQLFVAARLARRAWRSKGEETA